VRVQPPETGACPHTAIREDASINLDRTDFGDSRSVEVGDAGCGRWWGGSGGGRRDAEGDVAVHPTTSTERHRWGSLPGFQSRGMPIPAPRFPET
jgi:hypothetical protein